MISDITTMDETQLTGELKRIAREIAGVQAAMADLRDEPPDPGAFDLSDPDDVGAYLRTVGPSADDQIAAARAKGRTLIKALEREREAVSRELKARRRNVAAASAAAFLYANADPLQAAADVLAEYLQMCQAGPVRPAFGAAAALTHLTEGIRQAGL